MNWKSGFTLIELLVACGIFLVLTGFMISNFPGSTFKIDLVTATSNVAVKVREAQIRASSVAVDDGLAAGYGIYFDSATSTKYTYFYDSTIGGTIENGIAKGNYHFDGDTEIKELLNLPTRFKLGDICVGTSHPFVLCTSNSGITSATIVYQRPSYLPFIMKNGELPSVITYNAACIELHSPKHPSTPGHARRIIVYQSGLVSIDPGQCSI